jgi:hypothetical protein
LIQARSFELLHPLTSRVAGRGFGFGSSARAMVSWSTPLAPQRADVVDEEDVVDAGERLRRSLL